ncbi:hypothetical protein SAMN06265373_11231 [Shimia sagamensis]|uniref:Uncharacterized protein n=1 Tax=Shimia sagamensis TaxID=1566352 RepID=A0ABY1PL11_9RHOB|nr:hypothetical protein SAMN06265373_11231 [Shimia sagamensis]
MRQFLRIARASGWYCNVGHEKWQLPSSQLTCTPEGPLIWVSSVKVFVFFWLGNTSDWCEASEACVGPTVIEVAAPRCDQIAGIPEAIEQVFVQTLISHPGV